MKINPHLALTVILVVFSLLPRAGSTQEWTRFRGPNGTGVAQAEALPTEWSTGDIRWKSDIPGIGHSSPVVWEDRVFLLSADPETATRHVLCYQATDGRKLWQRDFPSTVHRLHTRSSYASSTPTVDEQRVYVAWSSPKSTLVKAFTHLGEELWSRDLGPWVGQHGFGTSPILYKGMVILHNSEQAEQLNPGEKPGQSVMVAMDCETGKTRWETPLKTIRVCYSVPFIRRGADGKDELICTSTGEGIFSLDPLTGKRKWSIPGVFDMRVVNSPIEAGGLIFGTNGSGAYAGNYLVAAKPAPAAEVAYTLKNSRDIKAPYVPCLIEYQDYVYILYDRGYAACFHAPTGKIQWCERTGTNFNSSPVRIGDRIFAVDEDGTVWVIAADPKEYRVLARNELGELSRSTPAVSGGFMFVRTVSHLICVGRADAVAVAR